MATAGFDTASAAQQLSEWDLPHLTDTDIELSDCPDDLSEWSEARGDVQANQHTEKEKGVPVKDHAQTEQDVPVEDRAQTEQDVPVEDRAQIEQDVQGEEHLQVEQEARVDDYAQANQEAQPELDVQVGQVMHADSTTQILHQVRGTQVGEHMDSIVRAPAHLAESASGPLYDDTPLYNQDLPSPPGSQSSRNETRLPQSPIPTTPAPAAAADSHSLPSPTSPTSFNDSLDQPRSSAKKTKPNRVIQKPSQTIRSTHAALATPATPMPLRTSGRKAQAPAKFAGIESLNSSREPSPAPEPVQKSNTVVFNLPSDALRQIQERPRPTKRGRESKDPQPWPKKKSRKQDDSDQDTQALTAKATDAQISDAQVQNEQAHSAINQSQPGDELPPQPAAILPEPLLTLETGESDILWSTGKQLMEYAHPSGIPKESKPEPRGRPPAFANERYELVESIVNCKIYQAGCYTKDSFVYAFLYTGHPARRDFVDSSIVIARSSGGMETDGTTKERRLVADQKENAKNTRALKNTMKAYNPVVLVTKNGNPLMPSRMPRRYCVLGHYKPTHIWTEEQHGKKIVRYRFERLNPRDESAWFQPRGVEEVCPPGSLERPIVRSCRTCRKSYQQVYLQGWVCLNGDCQAFFGLPSSSGELEKLKEDGLVYDPRFVKQKTTWPGEHLQPSLGYRPLEVSDDIRAEDLYTRAAWNGMICPRCNGCMLRKSFLGWDCETQDCSFQFHPRRKAIPASALTDSGAAFTLTDGYTPSRDLVLAKEIRSCKPHYANNFRTNVFRFPIPGCYMAHKIANETINKAPGGPNDIFKELQLVDIGLRRRKITPEGQEDPSYIRHMNQNFGMRYNFTGTGINNSRSFEEAETPVIRDVRTRLNWSAIDIMARNDDKPMEEVAAARKPVEFNEELVLSYFEDQGIGFHDDGENGVGPVIGTLSVGDTGKMQIRMKAARYFGASRGGLYDHKYPPIPGCLRYEERIARHAQILRDAPEKNKQTYWKQVAKDLGLKRGGNKQPPVILELILPMGDEVFMVGHPIQAYYEHSVTHKGRMRFALTCRYIDPEFGKPEFEVGPDMGHYDGSAFPLPRDTAGNTIPNDGKFEDDDDDHVMGGMDDAAGPDEDAEDGGDDENGNL